MRRPRRTDTVWQIGRWTAVVVTERTRHGRAKRHTFVFVDEKAHGPARWHTETQISGNRLRTARAHGEAPELPRTPLDPVVHLADGVDVPAPVLAVILDALASQARHQIDLTEITVIVSQLGSRIARLDTLDDAPRERAEAALHTEILRRCITMGPSATS